MEQEYDSEPEFLYRKVSCRQFLKGVPNFKIRLKAEFS